MSRYFEVAKGYEGHKINLPKRATQDSAGYDFESAEDIVIVPIWRAVLMGIPIKPQKVHTGIKAKMEPDEVLKLYNRSNNPIERLLFMATGVSVIDADYHGNERNDGEITFHFWNFGIRDKHISKGDRIGQGVFQKFLTVDGDYEVKKPTRRGGIGSTGTTEKDK
jgi:dUTP pyrophosphatase